MIYFTSPMIKAIQLQIFQSNAAGGGATLQLISDLGCGHRNEKATYSSAAGRVADGNEYSRAFQGPE